jgi:hypothetical protein
MKWLSEKTGKHLLAAVLGLITASLGAVLLVSEVRQGATAHSGHIYVFAGMFGLGLLLIAPSLVAGAVKSIVVVVAPYLPEVKIGGRRKSDPPKNESDV